MQTKVRDMKRLKYLEVVYNPVTESVSSDFIWIDEDEEFYREDSAQENRIDFFCGGSLKKLKKSFLLILLITPFFGFNQTQKMII